jgi:hypothetical protein
MTTAIKTTPIELPEIIPGGFAGICRVLADSDDHKRRHYLAKIRDFHIPEVRVFMIKKLIAKLGSKDKVTRRQASLSLAEIGPPNRLLLPDAMLHNDNPAIRVAAVEVVSMISQDLDREEKLSLQSSLLDLHRVVDDQVATAIGRVIQDMTINLCRSRVSRAESNRSAVQRKRK